MHLEAGGFKSAALTMHTKMGLFLVAFGSLLKAFWEPWGHLWETFGELLQLFGSLFGDTAKVSKKSPKGKTRGSQKGSTNTK